MEMIIVLIVILIPIILVGGFIGIFGLEFLSGTNTYNGNGVSFVYPNDYNFTFVNDNSTFLIAENTKNPNLTFQVSKSPVNGNLYHNMSLDEYAQTFENDLKSKGWIIILADKHAHHADKTTKSVQGYAISYDEQLMSEAKPNSVNGDIFIFDKNGIRYTINFLGKGQQKYDHWAYITVVSSFKVE